MLHYEPKLIASPLFPKSLKRKEFFWKTALLHDPKAFYLLDKITQRYILREDPNILLHSNDQLNINIKGGITIGNLPDLASRGDSIGIMLAAILGPQLATMFAPFLTEAIAAPLLAGFQPLAVGIAANVAKLGALLSPATSAVGAAAAAV